MTKIELESLSLTELRQLQAAIPAELQKREEADKRALIAEISQIAKAKGYSLSDLLVGGKSPTAKPRLPPAYRHPTDSNLTWSGRGRKPRWLADLVLAGAKLEDFAV